MAKKGTIGDYSRSKLEKLINDAATTAADTSVDNNPKANLWYPPSTAHASDDEFDDATLDTDFAAYNFTDSAAVTISTDDVDVYDSSYSSGNTVRINVHTTHRPSWALIQSPGSNKFMSLTKDYTFPTNVLIYARMRFMQIGNVGATNNDGAIGIFITDKTGGNTDPNNYMAMYLNESDVNTVQAQWDKKVSGGYSMITNTGDVDNQGQALEYVAIHKVGSNYYGWAGSPSNWVYLGTTTVGFTPDSVGFVFSNATSSPGPMVVGVDFIRFLEVDKFVL